ncbi:MAG: Na+/H+ antiporter subunit D [Devosiaceae bacterium]|nr:Na+/H+ antiporter subunit D [Devosiaceae bacterium]
MAADKTNIVESSELPVAMIDVATSFADWLIILPTVIALMGAALLIMLRFNKAIQAGLAILIVVGIIILEVRLFLNVMEFGTQSMTMGKWLPPFGISFTVDVISIGFALAGAIVTLAVLIYAQADISSREVKYGFHSLVLLLLAGVTGAFMTGDLFNLYVWFEVMLIASFGLIIMGGRKIQLDGAIKYGFLNFLATTFFLISLGLIYGLFGTLNMADISQVSAQAPIGPLTAIGALLLLAFGMKGAAFPVNAWLPASYHTPHPAVSALFGGLLTKVGAYALLRSLLLIMPSARDFLDPVITFLAIATLILAPLGALAQTNLRRAIGFLLIGGVGSVLVGLGVPTIRGVAGASIYIFHSMLTISALYLMAGLIERIMGTQDTRKMGGLYSASSWLSILFLVLVFAVAGLPPFLGFWPKLLLIEASLSQGDVWLVVALVLNSLLTTIAGTRLWAHIFWRSGPVGENSEQENKKLKPLTLREKYLCVTPTTILVLFIVFFGLKPAMIFDAGRMAAYGLLDNSEYIEVTGLADPTKEKVE